MKRERRRISIQDFSPLPIERQIKLLGRRYTIQDLVTNGSEESVIAHIATLPQRIQVKMLAMNDVSWFLCQDPKAFIPLISAMPTDMQADVLASGAAVSLTVLKSPERAYALIADLPDEEKAKVLSAENVAWMFARNGYGLGVLNLIRKLPEHLRKDICQNADEGIMECLAAEARHEARTPVKPPSVRSTRRNGLKKPAV